MTTLEETIYLMDSIREHGELGLTCMTNDGEYEHLPEYCREENQDYWEWEHELRSEGSAGERAYALVRRAAEKAWQEKYGDHWTKGETITRRTTELLNLVDLRDRIKH